MALAILELKSNPSIRLPFQLRPSLMSLPLIRKRSPSIDATVCVSDIGWQIPAGFNESILAHGKPTA